MCEVSSLPLRFGHACFIDEVGPTAGHPSWFVIFHEMGHQTTIAQQGRAVFCEIYCAGGTAFVEGDASVLSMWSSHRMIESPALSQDARTSVRNTFNRDTAYWGTQLRRWERETQQFVDDNQAFTADMWNAIHARLKKELRTPGRDGGGAGWTSAKEDENPNVRPGRRPGAGAKSQ